MTTSSRFGNLIVLGGIEHPEFTNKVIAHLTDAHPELNVGLEPDNLASINQAVQHLVFCSGAVCPELPQVRDRDVFIVDPIKLSGRDVWYMCVMADAAFHASAARITATMPFFEGRQDRKNKRGVSITSALGLSLLEAAHVNRFLSLDLHVPQIQGMNRNCRFDTVFSSAIFLPIMKSLMKDPASIIVMGTDHGSVERNGYFAGQLNCEVGFVDKRRDQNRQTKIFGVLGNVKDKMVFLVDDIIDTGGSFVDAAEAIMNEGAAGIFGFTPHPILSTNLEGVTAGQRLAEAQKNGWIKRLYLSDTVPLPNDLPDNVEIVTATKLIADAIYLIHTGGSVSSLFFPQK